jgi:hypothetical protein
MIGKNGVRYLFRASCVYEVDSSGELHHDCGWHSGWYETSDEAKRAGRSHSHNHVPLTGLYQRIEDPSNKHVVTVQMLAQNPQTGYGMDVKLAEEEARE